MKKVLIVGSSGFIGSYLREHLSKFYIVECINKKTLDVLNFTAVSNFLISSKPDIVINCLTFGGKENVSSYDSNFVAMNMSLFYNFYVNSRFYKLFINIGSGSEFDNSTNIDLAKETDIFNKHPKEAYGFFKNFLAKSINRHEKFTTLRLFGCFGKNEPEIRLLKKYQRQHLQLEDRYFDYFSIQDFFNVVKYVIDNDLCGVDLNCTYKEKIKLSEFLSLYDKLNNRESNFVVSSVNNKNYTGDSSLLDSLNVNLNGLEHGLRNYNV